jgi:hypothetical protein
MTAFQIEMLVSREEMEEQTKLTGSLFLFWDVYVTSLFSVACLYPFYMTFPCLLYIDWAYSNGL